MRLGFLYIFSVLFLCVQHINAQNTLDIKKVLGIEGYVADEITHEPLSGSLIEMFSTDSILITSTKTKGVKGQKIARYRLYGERKKEALGHSQREQSQDIFHLSFASDFVCFNNCFILFYQYRPHFRQQRRRCGYDHHIFTAG